MIAAGVLAALSPAASAATLPAVVTPPSVSGGLQVGTTQTASDGTWSGDPVPVLSRRWLRCDDHGNTCAPIGESTATRALVHPDGGRSLRIEVTATNSVGSAVALSAPTNVVGEAPVIATAPAVTGQSIVGQTLTTDDGVWWGYPVPIVARAWQRCDAAGACTSIPYGNDRAYRVRHTDVGYRLRVAVSVASSLGTAASVSDLSAPVPPAAPLAIVAPTVPGAPVVGSPISGVAATWEGADTIRRSWERCDDAFACTPIRGASGLQYRVAAADLGNTLRLTETAVNGVGTSRTYGERTLRVQAPRARSLAALLRTLVPVAGNRQAIKVRCALDQPGIRTCSAALIHNGAVLTSGEVRTDSRTATSLTVRLQVTPALRRIAANPAGANVTLTAGASQDGGDGTWSAKRTLFVTSSTTLTEPAAPLFGASRARLRPTPALQRLRAAVADASSLVCTGHTARSGGDAKDLQLGLLRARAVCAYLTAGRKLTTVSRSSGSYKPVATNATARGRARNNRVTILVGYWRADPALGRRLP